VALAQDRGELANGGTCPGLFRTHDFGIHLPRGIELEHGSTFGLMDQQTGLLVCQQGNQPPQSPIGTPYLQANTAQREREHCLGVGRQPAEGCIDVLAVAPPLSWHNLALLRAIFQQQMVGSTGPGAAQAQGSIAQPKTISERGR
jgi:hypothetical protein